MSDLTFSMRDGKLRFTIGVQSFTLDYVPEDEAEQKFMASMLTQALNNYNSQRIVELEKHLKFVERWAVHHGSKECTSAESALGVIQHYPPIAEITAGYTDGKTPDTFNPFARIAELEAALRMAVTQNEHDMLMTGDELRECSKLLKD